MESVVLYANVCIDIELSTMRGSICELILSQYDHCDCEKHENSDELRLTLRASFRECNTGMKQFNTHGQSMFDTGGAHRFLFQLESFR